MKVSKVNPADFAAVKALFEITLLDLYTREGILESFGEELHSEIAVKSEQLELADGNTIVFLVAKINETVTGCIALTPPNDMIDQAFGKKVRGYEVSSVLVHPEYQRQGVGVTLFEAAMKALAELGQSQYYLDSGYPTSQVYWRKMIGEPTVVMKDAWGPGLDHHVWQGQVPYDGVAIDRLLQTKFRKKLLAPFKKAVEEFNLIESGDHVAVAISGGKDSLLMAKLFQALQREGKKSFEVEFLVMDPGYKPEHLESIRKNLETMGIPADIIASDVFEASIKASGDKTPCYMCARMRRGVLFDLAKQRSCNALALGHHYDDVIETVMMNILCNGEFKTMLPKVASEIHTGKDIIRPLYYTREADIIQFFKHIGITPLNCGCAVAEFKSDSKRREVKALIQSMALTFENVEAHIFSATRNVNHKYLL